MHGIIAHIDSAYRPLLERPARWTIQGGVYRSKEDLVSVVKASGLDLSKRTLEIVNSPQFTLMADGDQYDVFETSVEEFTGREHSPIATSAELYGIRDRLGFCDAPYETALLIGMCNDQRIDTNVFALSEPVALDNGGLYVLCVARYSTGPMVNVKQAHPGEPWFTGEAGRLLVCRKCLAA